MAVSRSKSKSSSARIEPESAEPDTTQPEGSEAKVADRQLVRSLAAIFSGVSGYRAMATLISPELAVTPFHVIQQSGLLERERPRESLACAGREDWFRDRDHRRIG